MSDAAASVGGEQIDLAHGGYRAVVTEVGASLRELTHDGRALVVGFPPTAPRPLHRGAVLAPWPNRITDGRYRFGDTEYQLPLTEPARHHALHGLVTWVRWEIASRGPDHVTLLHDLVAQTGYPFPLALSVTYRLGADGLHWSVRATNTGRTAAPYGTGPHPYLVGGAGRVDDWSLHLPAQTYLEVDDRLIPTTAKGVDGTVFDFRSGRVVAAIEIDHAFTGLVSGDDGRARVSVLDGEGRGVECSWETAACPWVQVHTADRPEPENNRVGLAVEPMTCPPDAFNSGTDLVVLEPAATHSVEWQFTARTGRTVQTGRAPVQET